MFFVLCRRNNVTEIIMIVDRRNNVIEIIYP